jgi:NitT/TauT family transport system ATP-binding protein
MFPLADWLDIRSLTFRYRSTAVIDGLSLSVPQNSPILAVVGRSGVGKSTLISLIAGHLAAASGEIIVGGERVAAPSAARPVVFQDHNLFPWKTALENVAFGLKCLGATDEEQNRRARGLLQLLGLHGIENLYPHALSGGMRQRVGLARALAVEPKCLLLDEPLSSLDAPTRETLRDEIMRLVLDRGLRVIIVTHDLTDAAIMAGTTLVMRGPADWQLVHFSGEPILRPKSWIDSPDFRARLGELQGLVSSNGRSERARHRLFKRRRD